MNRGSKTFSCMTTGFSLVELMIALVLSSLVIVGVVSLFSSMSNVNRMENGLARLQENGRFASAMIQQDIKMATALGGIRKGTGEVRGRVDPDISIWSYVDMAIRPELGLPGSSSGQAYLIPLSYMIRGYECSPTDCLPPLGDGRDGDDRYGGGLPAMGTAAGDRARGADVLTLRFLRDSGQRVNTLATSNGGAIQLADPLVVGPSRLVVLSDYQTTAIVSVAESGSTTVLTLQGNLLDASGSLAVLSSLSGEIRAASFDSSFLTVSYYLQLAPDPNNPARLVSNLMRRENGNAQEIAQGIERLDFLYHVESRDRLVSVLSADAPPLAGDSTASGFPCPALTVNAPQVRNLDAPYCAWRGVRGVELYLLANSVSDAGSAQEPFVYGFLSDGSANDLGQVELACDPVFDNSCPAGSVTELISGLPPGRMLRREFRTTGVVRNNAF